MQKKVVAIFLSLAFCTGFFFLSSRQKTKKILIPQNVLFSNPEISRVRVSPNATYISYLAPGGTDETRPYLNIWLSPRTNISKKKQITFATNRSISNYFWAYNNKHIMYLQDQDGDENWHIYGKNIETQETIDYTPFGNIHATIIAADEKYPNSILIGLNKDNPAAHDVYKLDLETRKLERVAENTGNTVSWLANNNLEICAQLQVTPQGKALLIRQHPSDNWQNIAQWDYADGENISLLSCNKKDNALYMLDCYNSNTCYLVKKSLIGKPDKIVASHPQYDINHTLFHTDTAKPLACSYDAERQIWHVIDASFKPILDQLQKLHAYNLHITNHDDSRRYWIVAFEGDTLPLTYYLYDDTTKQTEKIFSSRPNLEKYISELCPMLPITYTATDGLTIHGYMTYPREFTTHKDTKFPLVLLVHGGPWSRDNWEFNPQVQWLANRGYAVLQINFRSSTGYGKSFIAAGEKEWGGKMHQDLLDGVDWAVKQGHIDPTKVAISGGSYGGYAALFGACASSDVFCCAVDLVGPSNLITLLNSLPTYWEPYKKWFHKHVGDPATESKYLKSISPLFNVDNIKIPLLIAQGANDPRVKQAESEQIVTALKKRNAPHIYMLFPDEGHGFINEKNRYAFYQAYEAFLEKHLK